jgi:hypothetical protein
MYCLVQARGTLARPADSRIWPWMSAVDHLGGEDNFVFGQA